MAPVATKKHPLIRNRAAKAGVGTGAPLQQRTNAVIDDGFVSTKKDKRTIKKNVFLSRVEKVNQNTTSKKRRRPSKKLITNLQSLADNLPEIEDDDVEETVVGQAKIKRKSLKSRPGAMKRKEKIERLEKERFVKNIADMAGARPTGIITSGVDVPQAAGAPVNRWAALKSYLEATLEQKPEFVPRNMKSSLEANIQE